MILEHSKLTKSNNNVNLHECEPNIEEDRMENHFALSLMN